ncbi:MAG: bifunctional oligoribonuclease/PAP phosphatase NrnA [Clostridiales bacterium]|nr:bifunctional oligoribonuclease/PAP phosphatase NrnA [Clostridiales bacterium]
MKRIELTQIAERIKAANSAAILCHANPDGDALGSAYALKEMIVGQGKQAIVLCADPVPARLAFLFTEDAVPAGFAPDLVITVDVASPEQLGALKDEWLERVDIKIDHHLISPDFGRVGYVDAEAAAAGEIIAELAELMGGLTAKCANDLYCAIASDTGGFRYSNVRARTFETAARLLAAGADGAWLSEKLFETVSKQEAAAAGYVYTHAAFLFDGRFAIVTADNQAKQAAGFCDEHFGNASTLLRQIAGVELAVSARQSEKNPQVYKISMRSAEGIDCAALCAKLGGGGHKRAAGCTLSAASADEAQAAITALAQEVFHE